MIKLFSWKWFNETLIRALLGVYPNTNLRDKHGTTPLMRAVDIGSSRLVRDLLEKNADINAQDNFGFTALMIAAGSDHFNRRKIAKILLNGDADTELRNHWGVDARLIAQVQGNDEIIDVIEHRKLMHDILNP